MTDRELMQQALEALNRSDYLGWQLNIPIIKALRERLAQPEQEPVAWMDSHDDVFFTEEDAHKTGIVPIRPLYTSPPARKPLTDDALVELAFSQGLNGLNTHGYAFARAVEAAHGIKETT